MEKKKAGVIYQKEYWIRGTANFKTSKGKISSREVIHERVLAYSDDQAFSTLTRRLEQERGETVDLSSCAICSIKDAKDLLEEKGREEKREQFLRETVK